MIIEGSLWKTSSRLNGNRRITGGNPVRSNENWEMLSLSQFSMRDENVSAYSSHLSGERLQSEVVHQNKNAHGGKDARQIPTQDRYRRCDQRGRHPESEMAAWPKTKTQPEMNVLDKTIKYSLHCPTLQMDPRSLITTPLKYSGNVMLNSP